jgi:hypothetical protein
VTVSITSHFGTTSALQADMPKATKKTLEHATIDEEPRSEPSQGEARPRKSKKQSNPVKRWCFTLNNPTEQELAHVKDVLTEQNCEFAVVGKEKGAQGTFHLQGFVNLKVKRRLNGMKDWLSPRAHFEQAKGNDTQNDEYCSKEGDIHLRIGEPGSQGKRSDLKTAVELLHTTKGNLKMVAEACPATFIRYGRGLRDYWLTVGAKPRDYKTSVFVLVGPPGCGKSRAVSNMCTDEGVTTYYKPRGEWWDGYVGQDNVVIDDFYGWIKYDEMLRLCDRYPHKVPVKGAYAEFQTTSVYITSNIHVNEWYKFEKFDCGALMRRITSYQVWYDNGNCGAFYELKDMSPVIMPLPIREIKYNF